MTDQITTDSILAALVNPLVWENDGGDSLYASVELGGEFTKYYSIDDLGEYDLWGAYFGVRCHEFGGVVIWKGTGKAAARAAAEAHHRAQIAAELNLGLIERLVGAASDLAREMAFMLRHNPSKDGGMYRDALDATTAALATFRADAPPEGVTTMPGVL